jgi:hypothetical protein
MYRPEVAAVPGDVSPTPPKKKGSCKGEDTPKKLANFRELLSDWVEHVELNGAAQIEETATQLAED